MKFDSQSYRITNPGSYGRIALIIGAAGLALSAVGYFTDPRQTMFSYLTAFMFFVSFALGGLFFTMLHHLVDAKWSMVIRRLSESLMATMPLMFLLFIPIALGIHELYEWSHADVVAKDALLQKKAAYLNTTFFLIRAAAYFAIWIFLGKKLYGLSLKQDTQVIEGFTHKARMISAPGIILFAFTITLASFDWLMSLDPHWYSTIFGAYIFAGAFLGTLCLFTLICLFQQSKGVLTNEIKTAHYHDIGKFTLGFVIFWAYMAYSQYFLIWYANIPEETIWFLHRWEGSWKTWSLVLVFGHFAIPFLLLVSRAAKRSGAVMAFGAIWLLVMRYVDLHWIVLPNLHHHGVHFTWIDVATFAGVGGMFFWYFWSRYSSQPVIPVNDPGLQTSINMTTN
jgi:hypothetical protein